MKRISSLYLLPLSCLTVTKEQKGVPAVETVAVSEQDVTVTAGEIRALKEILQSENGKIGIATN